MHHFFYLEVLQNEYSYKVSGNDTDEQEPLQHKKRKTKN